MISQTELREQYLIARTTRTQSKVANNTGISKSVLSRFESGETELSLRHIVSLTKYLGLPLNPGAVSVEVESLTGIEAAIDRDPSLHFSAKQGLKRLMQTAYQEFAANQA